MAAIGIMRNVAIFAKAFGTHACNMDSQAVKMTPVNLFNETNPLGDEMF